MDKKLLVTSAIALLALCSSLPSQAQAPALYNTVSGTIWRETPPSNSMRETFESRIGGILVTLVRNADDSIIAATISNTSGDFTLNNYMGTGTYRLHYAFPSAGYSPAQMRIGSDSLASSAADSATAGTIDPNVVSTPPFSISSSTNIVGYGLGLRPYDNTITYWQAKTSASTLWNQAFNFQQSDNSIGTLTGVRIFATDAVRHPSIGVENTGASVEAAQVECNGRITWTPPSGGGATFQTNTSAVKMETLGVNDGVTDYQGVAGKTWYEAFSSGFFSRTVASGNWAPFRSATPATYAIGAAATSVTSITGSGNLTASVFTDAAAGVFVTYTYAAPVPLATDLLSFTAAKNGSSALITWTANAQDDARGYTVEKSTDGTTFSALGFVVAEAATEGAAVVSGAFKDARPAEGKNLYRLKQVDPSGRISYSSVRSLHFGSREMSQAYPNPANTSVSVEVDEADQIVLYNPLGQVVAIEMTQVGGKAVINTAALQSGIYSLRIIHAGNISVQRLSIEH